MDFPLPPTFRRTLSAADLRDLSASLEWIASRFAYGFRPPTQCGAGGIAPGSLPIQGVDPANPLGWGRFYPGGLIQHFGQFLRVTMMVHKGTGTTEWPNEIDIAITPWGGTKQVVFAWNRATIGALFVSNNTEQWKTITTQIDYPSLGIKMDQGAIYRVDIRVDAQFNSWAKVYDLYETLRYIGSTGIFWPHRSSGPGYTASTFANGATPSPGAMRSMIDSVYTPWGGTPEAGNIHYLLTQYGNVDVNCLFASITHPYPGIQNHTTDTQAIDNDDFTFSHWGKYIVIRTNLGGGSAGSASKPLLVITKPGDAMDAFSAANVPLYRTIWHASTDPAEDYAPGVYHNYLTGEVVEQLSSVGTKSGAVWFIVDQMDISPTIGSSPGVLLASGDTYHLHVINDAWRGTDGQFHHGRVVWKHIAEYQDASIPLSTLIPGYATPARPDEGIIPGGSTGALHLQDYWLAIDALANVVEWRNYAALMLNNNYITETTDATYVLNREYGCKWLIYAAPSVYTATLPGDTGPTDHPVTSDLLYISGDPTTVGWKTQTLPTWDVKTKGPLKPMSLDLDSLGDCPEGSVLNVRGVYFAINSPIPYPPPSV